jgi:hypothetical protein
MLVMKKKKIIAVPFCSGGQRQQRGGAETQRAAQAAVAAAQARQGQAGEDPWGDKDPGRATLPRQVQEQGKDQHISSLLRF